ncbi:pyrroline-5-carboxylate reductase [Chloroflexota bacterium]
MKISFIGGGNMGEAILAAVLKQGLSTPEEVCVSDVNDARRRHLEQQYRVNAINNNRLAAESGDVIVLAVKPQILPEVMAGIGGLFQSSQLVLSIIAGVALPTLARGLKHSYLVRVMPNTPAQIGEGISVWTATPEVTTHQKQRACAIIRVMGEEIYVAEEKYLDMATAVSGSGPAYFFYFVEALTAAALDIGLPPDNAVKLVMQTMLGSGHLLQKSEKSPAELRWMVTSPGGTTAAALDVLEKGRFAALISDAVAAAYRRARELGS